MTRQPHDELAKEYLEELLKPFGTVEIGKKVASEVQEIDLFFTPNESQSENIKQLGVLAELAKTSCLIEPFRNPCTAIEIRSCLAKLLLVHAEVIRQAKRNKESLSESELKLPYLWILTPTCSEKILNQFGAKLADPKQPVEELVELPKEIPFKANLLELLANWRKNLELRNEKTPDDREAIMNLSPAYLQDRQQWLEEGRVEGEFQGVIKGRFEAKLQLIENLLKVRFQGIDEELKQIIPEMVKLPDEELSRLLLTLSREELLIRFRNELN
jgi:hypothetical protein